MVATQIAIGFHHSPTVDHGQPAAAMVDGKAQDARAIGRKLASHGNASDAPGIFDAIRYRARLKAYGRK